MRELPRGTVTFLFTDIEGSTRLLQELGDGYADALAEHRRLLREAVGRHGGVEVDTQGDAFFVAFARAADAVAAAEDGQRALERGPVRVRFGIHTGEPVVTEEGYVGIDVHRAARICAAAHGGQVVVSENTEGLLHDGFPLEDLGLHRLKDLTEPVKLFQLGDGEFPPLRSLNATNLPRQPTPLVGRERELAQVLELLGSARLVTLTGAGGSGKTRLALQAAAEVVDEFKDGVFWVSLAALTDHGLVLPTIAATVGAKDDLAGFVDEKRLLLLLDNLEQILDCAPALAELLRSCPNLTLLVTSRAPLRLSGEQEYELPPLPEAEAVELFTQRARRVKAGFEPDDDVAEICRRLDGLPLALELAAARLKVLSPQQILDRLGQSVELLSSGARDAPERQQTLRATIKWSYDLLIREEQRLFARFAVFSGGCTLEAAEQVAETDMDLLQSLVDNSLVRHIDERFSMLETIRGYAAEQLEKSREARELKSKHAEWFLALVEQAETELEGAAQDAWLERLEDEHDNTRAALRWFLDSREWNLALRLASSLSAFWWIRGHWSEGRHWLEEALSQTAAQDPALRAKGLEAAAHLAVRQADFLRAKALAEESLAVRRVLGDTRGCARSLRVLAMAVWDVDKERFRAFAEESARLSREAADAWCLSLALNNLGYLALDSGDYERATLLLEEALALARAQRDGRGEAVFLENLALATLEQGRAKEALAHFKDSLRLAQYLGYVHLLADDLEGIAAVAADSGDVEAAARLVGGAALLRQEIGSEPEGAEGRVHARTVAVIEESLDPERLAAAWSVGHAMTSDELVEYALDAID